MKSSLVDSHAHLSMEDFNQDREKVIEKAFKEGISAILCPADLTEELSLAEKTTKNFHSLFMFEI